MYVNTKENEADLYLSLFSGSQNLFLRFIKLTSY